MSRPRTLQSPVTFTRSTSQNTTPTASPAPVSEMRNSPQKLVPPSSRTRPSNNQIANEKSPSAYQNKRFLSQSPHQPINPSPNNGMQTMTLIGFALLLSLLFVLSLASASHILHVHEIEQTPLEQPIKQSLHHASRQTLYRVPKSPSNDEPVDVYRVPKFRSHSFKSQLEVKTNLAIEDEIEKMMKYEAKQDKEMRNKRSSLSSQELSEEQRAIEAVMKAKKLAKKLEKQKLEKLQNAIKESAEKEKSNEDEKPVKPSAEQAAEPAAVADPILAQFESTKPSEDEENGPSAFAMPEPKPKKKKKST